MQPLITRNDIARYRQLSKTPHDTKLNEMILDAQMMDLQPLLGEKLFNQIMADPESHEALLTGGIYEHEGISYTNYGLKMVLAYFSYARYVMFGSVTDTPFSVVEKLGTESRPAELSTKKSMYSMNREGALQLWENVKNYLTRVGYPGYESSYLQPVAGLRFTKIK